MDESEKEKEQNFPESETEEPPKKVAKLKTPARVRPTRLPLGRIKQIIKTDPDVSLASADSVFLITKATELFVEALSRDAHSHLAKTKMKTLLGRHVDSAIAGSDALAFLERTPDV